ncbi:2498_t:CDS:1, partial [Acaulospora colombiana]
VQSTPIPAIYDYVRASDSVRRSTVPFGGPLGPLGGVGSKKLKDCPPGTSITSSSGATDQNVGQTTEISDSSDEVVGGTYQGSSGGTYGKKGSRISPFLFKNKMLGMVPII